MDVIPYTGLPRDRHRMLKVFCAATDQTMGGFHADAMTRVMAETPGMDAVETLIGTIQQAAVGTQPEAKQINGKLKK